eukprot:453147-Rhodomonas_salina.3
MLSVRFGHATRTGSSAACRRLVLLSQRKLETRTHQPRKPKIQARLLHCQNLSTRSSLSQLAVGFQNQRPKLHEERAVTFALRISPGSSAMIRHVRTGL